MKTTKTTTREVSLDLKVSLKKAAFGYRNEGDNYYIASATINGKRVPSKALNALMRHLWAHHLATA